MKQAYLIGKIKGLRPGQRKRLQLLLHSRHPFEGLDQSIIQKILDESLSLNEPIHVILDDRGLCRVLFIGILNTAREIYEKCPLLLQRKLKVRRLISFYPYSHIQNLACENVDAIVALDLKVIFWLSLYRQIQHKGEIFASLLRPNTLKSKGWDVCEKNYLTCIIKNLRSYEFEKQKQFINVSNEDERVLLLMLKSSNIAVNLRELVELKGLIKSAGASTISIASQRKKSSNIQTIWGRGKLQEVALEVRRNSIMKVITDRELTPSQSRNLENILDCHVMDRSELILDIFAQRASTSSGKLQVELAQLRYLLPKLAGSGSNLSRQGGGIGTRGPGEKKLEKDRRAILRRIDRLKEDFKELKNQRAIRRRKNFDLPRIAIVGYTNAGKSTFLNTLCDLSNDRRVVTQNKLFATLDPATRRLIIPRVGNSPRELLIVDTVGFIRELPSTLMEAFQATIEEALDADLLLLLVDISNDDWKNQLKILNILLDSFDSKSKRQVIANQIDICNSSAIDDIADSYPGVLYVSALSGAGLKGLKNWLENYFWSN